MNIPGIFHCHAIRAHGLNIQICVATSIHLESSWSVEQAHVLSSNAETFLLIRLDSVEDVVIHIEPEGHDKYDQ